MSYRPAGAPELLSLLFFMTFLGSATFLKQLDMRERDEDGPAEDEGPPSSRAQQCLSRLRDWVDVARKGPSLMGLGTREVVWLWSAAWTSTLGAKSPLRPRRRQWPPWKLQPAILRPW